MRRGLLLAAAVLLAGTACSRCGTGSEPGPERFLAPGVPGAVVVPRLDQAQEQAAPLLATLATFPAAADLVDRAAAVRAQLGFDPLDRGALRAQGLDPSRGAALALPADGPPVLVLPVDDAGRFEALLARLVRDRLGAGHRLEQQVGGRRVVAFDTGAGAPAALAVLFAEGSALVAAGPAGPARLAEAANRPAAGSLAADPSYRAARTLLGERALLAWVPPSSPAAGGAALARDGVALGLSASALRLTLAAALPMSGPRLDWWRKNLGGADGAGAGELDRLPADAFLAGRASAEPAVLAGRLFPALPAAAQAGLAAGGLDPGGEAWAALGPGAVAAVALAPTFDVGAVTRGAPDLAAQDLFRQVHLAAVLQVRDARRLTAALDRATAAAAAAPAGGLAAERRPAGPLPGWRLALGPTALDLALDGGRLLVGGGPGRLDALRAASGGYRAPTDAARDALRRGSAGAVLDLGRLVQSFRALPPGAYGSGPDAFVMRSLAERVIDPASRLVAASVRLDVRGDGARAELVLDARPPAGSTP